MRATSPWLCVAAMLLSASAWAQQAEPIVEISVDPEVVSVGEPITMRVAVYVPTWFTRPAQFPSFEVPNAITRLPPNSSHPVSKRVGRESWSGISHRYLVYPMLGARFRLDSSDIRIEYANPGGDPIRARAPTGEIVFSAVVPEGAEDLNPYIAGTRLEVSREIEGTPEALAVGDALVVTYTAKLEGLSAIFLPDLVAPADIPGVSIYPEQPIVEDGDVARRIEKVTYIFNAGGDFSIPAVNLDWWNQPESRVETATVAALPLTVEGPPLQADPEPEAKPERNWSLILGAAVVLLLLLRWAKRSLPALRASYEQRKARLLASEEYAWGLVLKTLHGRDVRLAHEEIMRWLGKISPGLDLGRFCERYGDTELSSELAAMSRSLYAGSNESPDLGKISRRLADARKRCLEQGPDTLTSALPPLNP